MTTYQSHADTNKLIRKALKEAFPGIVFSVRKSGGSTYICWTDGPTQRAVDKIAKHFQGATFDGMTDYRGGAVHSMNGEEIHFGADFVFTTREITDAHRATCLAQIDALTCEARTDWFNSLTGPRFDGDDWRKDAPRVWELVNAKPSPTLNAISLVRTY